MEPSYSAATDSFRRVDSISGLIDASESFRLELVKTGGLLSDLVDKE